MKEQRPGAVFAGACVVFILFALLCWRLDFMSRVDSDRYYHFAISRMTSEDGLLRFLPQAQDVGWGQYFPDKEFLFHQWTALGYRLSADRGVIACVGILGGLALGLLFVSLCRFSGVGWSLLVTVALLLGSTPFINRMILVRPHVAGVFAFAGLLWGALSGNAMVCGIFSLIFVLAYHAFYVPVILLLGAYIFRSLWARKSDTQMFLCGMLGLIGLAIGFLINPYFPSNLLMGLTHLKIALSQSSLNLNYGLELRPYSWKPFLITFGIPISLSLGCVGYLVWTSRLKKVNSHAVWIAPVTVLFWILTKLNPRALEYAYPLTAILCSLVLSEMKVRWPIKGAIVGLIVLVQAPFWWLMLNRAHLDYPDRAPGYFAALKKIPENEQAKVFNCSWDSAPYILYLRPHLRFVDLLDPTFLLQRSEEKFRLRNMFVQSGGGRRPATVLRGVFQADYVLCQNEQVNRNLLASGDFRLLHPLVFDDSNAGRQPHLFVVPKVNGDSR